MSSARPLEPDLRALTRAAAAAPSVHGARPWDLRYDAEWRALMFRAVPARSVRFADPEGRAAHVSCGAAALNVRVAATHEGWEPVVRLLPEPHDPLSLVEVRLAGPLPDEAEPADDDALFDAVRHRRSSPQPFDTEPLPPALAAELADAARVEGAELTVLDPLRAAFVHGLVETADERRRSGRSPSPGGDRPMFALVTTREDHPADWLRAGQAWERVWLTATARGVRMSLVNGPLEWPDLRQRMHDPDNGIGHVQAVVRMGYGTPPVRDASPPPPLPM